jgi:hypothetical protein
MWKSCSPVAPALFFMLVVAACTSLPLSEPRPTPTREEVLADCFITFHLSAYEDFDLDGVRDEGEEGLAGIEFVLNGNYAHSVAGGRAVTDQNGDATIDTWSPGGCQEFSSQFSIDAVAPADYTPSADFPFEVHSDRFTQQYEFGFYPAARDSTP